MKSKLIFGRLLLLVESILLLSISVFIILNSTFFKKEFITSKLDETNYYHELYDYIKNQMTYYTTQAGFEDSIIDDTFTEQEVKYFVNKYIECAYSGEEFKFDSSSFEEKLNKKIDDFIESENFTIENRKSIDKFVEDLAKVYKDEIEIVNVSNIVGKGLDYYIYKISNCIIIPILALILIVLLNMVLFKTYSYGVPFYFVGFMFIALNIYIRSKLDINHLLIYSKMISTMVISSINQILDKLIGVSIICFMIGLLLSIIEDVIHTKKELKRKEKWTRHHV